MAGENEMRIIFGADTTPLRTEVAKATSTVDKFAGSVEQAAGDAAKGFDQLRKSVKGVPEAFDKVAGGSVILNRIAANLDSSGKAAIESAKAFKVFEGAPLQTLDKLDAAIAQIRLSLANGFKANLDTSGLSPQVFAQVGSEAKDVKAEILSLALALNQALVEAKAFGSTLEKQFHLGISEELQRAGISVAAFKDALASLTGTGGANLTPLLTALDSIQAESAGTTQAIKNIGGALAGVSVLAKSPINDLKSLDAQLKLIKGTLAAGIKPNIEQIKFQPADFKGIQNEINASDAAVQKLNSSLNKTVSESVKAIDRIKDSATGVPKAFNNISGVSSILEKLSATLKQTQGDAEKWLNPFKDAPKVLRLQQQSLKILDQDLRAVKNTLNSGFKPAIDSIKLSASGFSDVASGSSKMAAALNKVKPGANQAATAITNLGRVAQDAPFGFIAISNNIDPLLDSFSRLRKETGTTGGALKALSSSLVGGAGIGLAFSVVTALVVKAIQEYGSLGNALDAVFGSFDAIRTANTQMSKAFGEATASVQGELTALRALVAIAQDDSQSRATREQAIKKINDQYSKYLPNLSLENVKTKAVTDSVNKLTAALLRQAKIKGLQDAISKQFEKISEAMGDTVADNVSWWQELDIAIRSAGDIGQQALARTLIGAENTGKSISKTTKVIDIMTKSLNKLLLEDAQAGTLSLGDDVQGEAEKQKKIVDFIDKRTAKLKELIKANQDVNKNTVELKGLLSLKIKLDEKAGTISPEEAKQLIDNIDVSNLQKDAEKALNKEIAAIKDRIDAVKKLIDAGVDVSGHTLELKGLEIKLIRKEGTQQGFTQEEIEKLIFSKFPDFKGGLTLSKPVQMTVPFEIKPIASAIKQDPLGDDIGLAFEKRFPELAKKFAEQADILQKQLQEPLEQLKTSINGTISSAFQGLGEGIGDILQGANPLQTFISIIADALQQLGAALIAFGIAKKFAIESLKSLNPYIAIAAGVGAIAAAKLLKSKLNKTQKFADGGLVMGPTMGMIGEAGPEMVIPLNRANQFLDNMGGVDVSGELRIRGNDLVMAVARNTGSLPRRGGGF